MQRCHFSWLSKWPLIYHLSVQWLSLCRLAGSPLKNWTSCPLSPNPVWSWWLDSSYSQVVCACLFSTSLPATSAPGARPPAPSSLARKAVFVFVEDFLISHTHIFCRWSRKEFYLSAFPVCHLARANELLPKYFLMLMKCVYSCALEVTPPSAEGATSQECQRHVLSSRVSFPRSDHWEGSLRPLGEARARFFVFQVEAYPVSPQWLQPAGNSGCHVIWWTSSFTVTVQSTFSPSLHVQSSR